MMEPVIWARTTEACPSISTKMARTNSATEPKLTFNKPPMAGPAVSATDSVALLMWYASAITPIEAVAKTQKGEAPTP